MMKDVWWMFWVDNCFRQSLLLTRRLTKPQIGCGAFRSLTRWSHSRRTDTASQNSAIKLGRSYCYSKFVHRFISHCDRSSLFTDIHLDNFRDNEEQIFRSCVNFDRFIAEFFFLWNSIGIFCRGWWIFEIEPIEPQLLIENICTDRQSCFCSCCLRSFSPACWQFDTRANWAS
jgi:hypothetical protein